MFNINLQVNSTTTNYKYISNLGKSFGHTFEKNLNIPKQSIKNHFQKCTVVYTKWKLRPSNQ